MTGYPNKASGSQQAFFSVTISYILGLIKFQTSTFFNVLHPHRKEHYSRIRDYPEHFTTCKGKRETFSFAPFSMDKNTLKKLVLYSGSVVAGISSDLSVKG